MAERLPVDGELLRSMRELLEKTAATSIAASFDIPDTDLELIITLRFKEEEG